MMANDIYLLLIEHNGIYSLVMSTAFRPFPCTQTPQSFKATAVHARSSHRRLHLLLLGGRAWPLQEHPVVGVFRDVLSEDDLNDGPNTHP